MGANVTVEKLKGRTTLTLSVNGKKRETHVRSGQAVTLTEHFERRDSEWSQWKESQMNFFIDVPAQRKQDEPDTESIVAFWTRLLTLAHFLRYFRRS